MIVFFLRIFFSSRSVHVVILKILFSSLKICLVYIYNVLHINGTLIIITCMGLNDSKLSDCPRSNNLEKKVGFLHTLYARVFKVNMTLIHFVKRLG